MTNSSLNRPNTFHSGRLLLGLIAAALCVQLGASAAPAPVALGSTTTFGGLAATTVTALPPTTVNGNPGASPGNTVTGAPIVNGTLHLADPTAAQAQLDLTTAYNDAAGRTLAAVTVAGNLGGRTLAPGLYTSATSLEISSGELTRDAFGDPNGAWIYQMGSTLVTTVGRQVILTGEALAADVLWQVGSSATSEGNSGFKGSILADQSITMDTRATLEGRALARNGQFALDAYIIRVPGSVTGQVLPVSVAGLADQFTDAPGHSVNSTNHTITAPVSDSNIHRFFRIQSTTALSIANIVIVGGNVVITYNSKAGRIDSRTVHPPLDVLLG